MYKLKSFITCVVLCLSSIAVFAQNSVTGNISDVNGEAVIGASILEKGTTKGTVTDVDGNFALNVSQGAVLQVSYIGYETQEITVDNQQVINVVLQEDARTLEELVVVGY